MASQQQQQTQPSPSSGGGGGGAYKRASRKGAPRRFSCEYPGCDKVYSRAEHLQRHQLNHNPKEIFRCDLAGCDQKFVRADLLARHKKRHSASYTPRNRLPSFSAPREPNGGGGGGGGAVASPLSAVESRASFPHPSPSVPHDANILLTPEPSSAQPSSTLAHQQPAGWHTSMDDIGAVNIIRPKPTYYPTEAHHLPEQPDVLPYGNVQFHNDDALARETFAVWLFNPQATFGDLEYNVAQLPFLEGGLESTFDSNIHYDHESLASTTRSQLETPPRILDGEELLTDFRRTEILKYFRLFRQKQPKLSSLAGHLAHERAGDYPGLGLGLLGDCLREYWGCVSPRLPIVHQATFSCNRCSTLLLMVMIALGAASLRGRDQSDEMADYGAFAEIIISSVRFEILTAEDASPPVALWVAQALLLLEFYEKMYSSRKLHERAHIYHSATLTLLRRGSPLIGRSGSESPLDEQSVADHFDSHLQGAGLDSRTWWTRWAATESMHRVVFAAFMLDIIHAAMFGHNADMAPHEIRLPLPCDDNLWTASSPDVVRQLDANLRMYGVKPISFLDGLKRALHGKEVRTHSFGRMIIMSGLLSVGWHLSHRETHMKWLDLTNSTPERHDNWRKILLRAFDDWKESFDAAQGSPDSINDPSMQRGESNGPIQSAAVLYHLAHISLHVNIIDCQVYAGAKRLLGRKVSVRDYNNVGSRMRTWAGLPSTRHAVLHAFRLLHRTLVDPRPKKRAGAGPLPGPLVDPAGLQYSCRSDPDAHRPWIMYYAVLSIWSFVRAFASAHGHVGAPALAVRQRPLPHQLGGGAPAAATYRGIARYVTRAAECPELTETVAGSLWDGLPDLLDGLQLILGEAHSEILQEAHDRLSVCRDMLASGT